ncbi:HNH endonuclease [Nocardioides solisilvae]|uniref:HNH endonuclease n=1 Tax=Nocardioides solisilvae TaxID=1542435 RepID=UPI0013A58822|nr:HNH endonuclease [Nocardioides solisilvae]
MIETGEASGPTGPGAAAWSVAELEGLVAELASNVVPEVDPRACLAQVEVLEAMKAALAAAQVRATAAYAAAEVRRLEECAEEARRAGAVSGRGPAPVAVVAAQVGLTRRESPARGRAWVSAASALVADLPRTLEALGRGVLTEERAMVIVRETADLTAEDRRAVDAELTTPVGPPDGIDDQGNPRWDDPTGEGQVAGLGTEALRRLVQRLALRHDSTEVARRRERARARRRVSGRLLGDGTGRITAVVKAEHYAHVMAALGAAAATARNEGDARSGDQVRADTLVARVTGVDPTAPVPVELHLVVPATGLLGQPGAPAEPGWILGSAGGAVVPAGICRDLFTQAAEAGVAAVRRVFADRVDGRLVAMESSNRTFTGLLARLIRIRDGGTCRTPWCDAPAKHVDHVDPAAEGGPTSEANGQGLCEACNQVKEAPGWSHWVGIGGRTHVTTPTGATYTSRHTPLAS